VRRFNRKCTNLLEKQFVKLSSDIAEDVSILYGGRYVKPENAKERNFSLNQM
jgi:hypothetical protein